MVATGHAAAVADASRVAADARARVEEITFHDESAATVINASTGAPLTARVHYRADAPVANAVVEVFYYSRDGRVLHCQQSTALTGAELDLPAGSGAVEFTMPWLGLQPGIYSVGATIRQRTAAETIDWFYGRTMLYVEAGKSVRGYFYTPHDWRVVAGHGREDHGAGL
jgi:hypothetical protein